MRKPLTDKYFFDTDCISAFLWIREENILSKLYEGKIILPAQVYDEIVRVPHLVARVDAMREQGVLVVESMVVNSEEYRDYLMMTTAPEDGARIIGNGEAAGIAMVKNRGGILASNNLRDISSYLEKYSIQHITTGDILAEALSAGIITEEEGNTFWERMIRKRRMLPTITFTEYLKKIT